MGAVIKLINIHKKLSPFVRGCGISFCLLSAQGVAEELTEAATHVVTHGDFGSVGLLQLPTARMDEEGSVSVNLSHANPYTRLTVTAQPFSWLETSVRYTDVNSRLYGAIEGNTQTFKDKSIDAKIRLLQETDVLPELAIGVRDLGGTGLFGSEYVAASKSFGPVDATLGIVWGYHGTEGNIDNPLAAVSEEFNTRPNNTVGRGGVPDTQRYFRGRASVYGGVEWAINDSTHLKLEYDPNTYEQDFGNVNGNIRRDSPVNIGVSHRFNDHVVGQLAWERGNTLSAGLSIQARYQRPSQINRQELPAARLSNDLNRASLSSELAQKAGWLQAGLRMDGSRAILTGYSSQETDLRQLVPIVSRIAFNHLPERIQRLTVRETTPAGIVLRQLNVERGRVQALRRRDEAALAADFAQGEEVPAQARSTLTLPGYQNLRYQHGFSIDHSLGAPEKFVSAALLYNAAADLDLGRGWTVGAAGHVNLANNYEFHSTDQPADGRALPPVRTLVRKYKDRPVTLSTLDLAWQGRIAPQWYAQAYGGLLETMYAGAGAEVLYRPVKGNWAIGADINRVQQRDPQAHFGLLDYQATTGHITGYWNPVPQVLAKVSAGQYLAGDQGVTFDLSRTFDSGATVGAYAALTDVSADDFGEGSFHKGFYLKVPLSRITGQPSRHTYDVNWIPLQRDGGQMLARRSLFNLTSGRAVN